MIKRSIFVLMIFALILTACSAASATPQPGETGRSEAPSEPSMPPSAAPGIDSDFSGSGVNASAVERLVVKNADMAIAVVNPLETLDVITSMAEEMEGFVVSSRTYKTSLESGVEVPEADVTIRVPAERFSEALDRIEQQVRNPETDVLSRNETGDDVTDEYTDLQSRLRNLEQAEEQLREIMGSATRPEDVLNVFNQLTSVREQIEVLKGQIQYYQEAAALSAISVRIRAEASVQPLTIAGWKPVGTARSAVQALINTLQFLGTAAIWLVLLILPVFLILFIPLRLLWTAFNKRRSGPRQPAKPATPPPAPPSS